MLILKKKSYCDLDLGPRPLKLELDQNIVIQHICEKQNQNQFMNEGARALVMFSNSNYDLDLGPRMLKL